MKRRKTENVGYLINNAQTIDFNSLGGIMDFAFKNNGDTDATITINNIQYILKQGEPMLSFLGYWNCYRNDIAKIVFTAPIGINPRIEIFATKEVQICDFEI